MGLLVLDDVATTLLVREVALNERQQRRPRHLQRRPLGHDAVEHVRIGLPVSPDHVEEAAPEVQIVGLGGQQSHLGRPLLEHLQQPCLAVKAPGRVDGASRVAAPRALIVVVELPVTRPAVIPWALPTQLPVEHVQQAPERAAPGRTEYALGERGEEPAVAVLLAHGISACVTVMVPALAICRGAIMMSSAGRVITALVIASSLTPMRIWCSSARTTSAPSRC